MSDSSIEEQTVTEDIDLNEIEDIKADTDHDNRAANEMQGSLAEFAESTAEIGSRLDVIHGEAGEQYTAIMEVADETSTLSASVEEIASSAEEVSAAGETARTLAEDGQQSADEIEQAMQGIQSAATEIAEDVRAIQQSVTEIDQVVEVINSIADQTNLLALNASIEAANADQAGAGFAVVANEVKALAEDSQDRATEIEHMIDDVQANTHAAVENLDENNERIAHGINAVNQATTIFEEIHETVDELSDGIAEVATATDQQASSTEEVASMVDQTVSSAQSVAGETEAIAAEVESQSEQIQELDQTLGYLVTDLAPAPSAPQ